MSTEDVNNRLPPEEKAPAPDPITRGADGGSVDVHASHPPTNVYAFMAGKAWGDGQDGHISFKAADGQEMIRLESGGKVFIRGVPCDDNPFVYRTFRAWLGATTYSEPTVEGGQA